MEGQTPSIKEVSRDARGEIYVITLPGDRELLLLHSFKGTLRGGHSHDVNEIVTMLSGKMLYHKRINGRDVTVRMLPGDTSFNPAGEAHMGEFTEDTWLTEWKIGTKIGAWTNEDYAPWREQVMAHARA